MADARTDRSRKRGAAAGKGWVRPERHASLASSAKSGEMLLPEHPETVARDRRRLRREKKRPRGESSEADEVRTVAARASPRPRAGCGRRDDTDEEDDDGDEEGEEDGEESDYSCESSTSSGSCFSDGGGLARKSARVRRAPAAQRVGGLREGEGSSEAYLDGFVDTAGEGSACVNGPPGGRDGEISRRYMDLKRSDMFVVALGGVDETRLTMSEKADREAFTEKNAARKRRSAHSHGNVNTAVALFCAWMSTKADLQEEMDDKLKSLYYPSPRKLIAFIRWQEGRREDHDGAQSSTARRRVHAVSIQTSVTNLSAWADHLRNVQPHRFRAAVSKPCTNDSVLLVMRAVHDKHAGAIRLSKKEYLDGVTAVATYGRERRRAMVTTLFVSENPRPSLRLLADTNLRHALICRGELTRHLTFNNLSLLQEDLTPSLGPGHPRAMVATVRTGKTVKFGRARSIMCLEALDATLCPLFSLAAYLFWRFDVDGDSIPNFLDRTEWYASAVFTGAKDGTPYTESAQYGSVRALHKAGGVWGKVVHGARVSASQEDARNRVPPLETQSVTHAKDSRGAAIGMTTLVYRPLSTMSAVSQSGAVGRGETAATASYFCPRQEVEVPPQLADQLFKGFTACLKNLDNGTWRGTTQTTRTERATLELMSHLRLVLCRGAAELRPHFPNFALYKKYPFNSQLFTEWGRNACEEIDKLRADAATARLTGQASPAVVDELRGIATKQDALASRLEGLESAIERSEKTAKNLMDMVTQLAFEGGPGAERLHRIVHPRQNDPPPQPDEQDGWFKGTLPGLGRCGGTGGSIASVWEVWGGRGPSFVLGGEEGKNLKSHGRVTQRQANNWGSSSTYGRYKLAGRYMESTIQLVEANNPDHTHEQNVREMVWMLEKDKGDDSVTQWYSRRVAGQNT